MKTIQKSIMELSEKYSDKLFYILLGAFVLQVLLTLVGFVIKANFVVFQLIIMLAIIFCYIASKPLLDDKKAAMSYQLAALSPLFFLFSLATGPLFSIAKNMAKEGNTGAPLIILFGLMLGFASIVAYFTARFSEKGKAVVEKTKNYDLSKKINEAKDSSFDIVVCKNAKTGEDEKLLFKDRFLHMLILGPTGCGKTSQVLIPMITQDVRNLDCGVTVLEPKGDLVAKIAMYAKKINRPYVYFDPSMKNCPFFNPLVGREAAVIENLVTTFTMLSGGKKDYFNTMGDELLRHSCKVLKRLDRAEGVDGRYATLINLARLTQNSGGQGRDMVQKFSRINSETEAEAKENADIASYFLNDYFGERSKTYEVTSNIRALLSRLGANQALRRILNPDIDKGEKNELDFDKVLKDGELLCISTAQGMLQGLGKFLGYFIILNFQAAVFRRPGNEETRRPHFLYIDEFQTYSTPGFSDMLTQGRSYRVASHIATQGREQITMGGGSDGKAFLSLVSVNARNVIVYPGVSAEDARYYSLEFGDHEEEQEEVGHSRKTFNLFTGGMSSLGHPTETVRTVKKTVPNMTSTEIRFRQFGEISCEFVKNNTLCPAFVGKIEYINPTLNAELDNDVKKYYAEYQEALAMIEEPSNSTDIAGDVLPSSDGLSTPPVPGAVDDPCSDPIFSPSGINDTQPPVFTPPYDTPDGTPDDAPDDTSENSPDDSIPDDSEFEDEDFSPTGIDLDDSDSSDDSLPVDDSEMI